MTERTTNPRNEAQEEFEKAGCLGFVEDFIEAGVDDLTFMAMPEKDQKFWIRIVERFPSMLVDFSFPE